MVWFFLLIATCFVATYWKASLLALSCILAYKTIQWVQDAYECRKAAQREAERRLTSNADREHKLIQQGNADGIYGDYQIPAETRGIGIWLAD